jgi:hypothetical protein
VHKFLEALKACEREYQNCYVFLLSFHRLCTCTVYSNIRLLRAYTVFLKIKKYRFVREIWQLWENISYMKEFFFLHHVIINILTRVFTKFRRHGIPYVFFTSVYSVSCPELAKIPRNYTDFRIAEFWMVRRISTEFNRIP